MSFDYLDLDDALLYHQRIMAVEGQKSVLMEAGRLEAALFRPQTSAFGEDIFATLAEKAAALLQGIVMSHPFQDGNKRAGLGFMLAFLELNGVRAGPVNDELYELVMSVTTGELREVDDIAARIVEVFHLEAE